jgi:hypothetical protein
MAKPVNLNRYRKQRTRDERVRTAEANRAKFGRTKAERLKEEREQARGAAALDGKRRESGEDDDRDDTAET